MKGKVDYIVVGLGIAGANVIQELIRRNLSFVVFDDSNTAASFIAAGLVNPVTGRNYVKSWNIDALLPLVKRNYTWFEHYLSAEYIYKLDIRRALNSAAEENKWASRLGDASYDRYLSSDLPQGPEDDCFSENERIIKVLNGFRVDLGRLILDLKEKLLVQGLLFNEHFSPDLIDHQQMDYKDIQFKGVIFCEGAFGMNSPFSDLPITNNLGEAFVIDIPGYHFSYAIKKGVFIVPLEMGYWVGGTYTNLRADSEISPDYDRLEKGLRDALNVPFRIIRRMFGVRPTVPDRRPLVGTHSEYPHMFVLNGLGTKGTSLAPFCAHRLLDLIEKGDKLPTDIDISRFKIG